MREAATAASAAEDRLWSGGESDEPITRQVDKLLDRYHSASRLRLSGSPYIDLPSHVHDAVAEAASVKGYPPSPGLPKLREAIAAALEPRGVRADAGRVLVTNGAMHALDLVFRSVLHEGDEVLMPAPGFFIGGLVRRAGGRLMQFPSPASGGFRPSWESAAALVTPRTRILYVNTPVNPTGYVYDEHDIQAAKELADKAGLLLLSDESLSHFVYGGRAHLSPASNPSGEMGEVLVGSFSKDFAMPGMRVGYAVLPGGLVEQVAAMLEWSVLCANRLAQSAALAALTGPAEWIGAMVEAAGIRGRRVAAELDSADKLSCPAPGGGLNLFPRFTGDAERLAHDLVVRDGVPVCPGSAFGGPPGHFRIQFGGANRDVAMAIARVLVAAA